MWKCSIPQRLSEEVVFCGLQIKSEGSCYLLSQSKYAQELQQRHPEIRPSRTLPSFRDEEPPEDSPRLEEVREAQEYLGELQWLSCRSRPNISFSVRRASRLVAKNPRYAIKVAKQILAYLSGSVGFKLKYGKVDTHPELATELRYERSMGLVEAFSDASFGCEDIRSQSGVVVLLGGCPVAWLSVPQPFTTLSTCEAELVGACEALTLSQAILPLWQELTETATRWVAITDSVSAAAVLLYPAGSWRTRHLSLRCRAYQELIEDEVLTSLAHVKGQHQLADLLTKALSPPRVKQLLDYLGCLSQPTDAIEDTGEIDRTGANGSSGSTGVAKSLVVLSCLLSPVKAQPSGGLRMPEGWGLSLFAAGAFLCLLVLWYVSWMFREQRLRRLRARGREATENLVDLGSSLETLELWELEEIDNGSSSTAVVKPKPYVAKYKPKVKGLPMIKEARSTVGVPPPLDEIPASNPKRVFRKAPPPILHSTEHQVKAPVAIPKPPPTLHFTGPHVKAPVAVPKYPVKRPPLLPVQRFYGPPAVPSLNEGTGARELSPTPNDNDHEDTRAVVHTPPRQASTELPPLFAYVEIVQRAMRRELSREPSPEEVEEEIRQMGIRNAISAVGDSSDPDGSVTESSESTTGDYHQLSSSSSGFTYLPPTPVPIVRLVAPKAEGSRRGDVVWEAERVDGGQRVPTTVTAHERPSGSSDTQAWYVDDAVGRAKSSVGTS